MTDTTLDAAIEAAMDKVDITWKGDMRAFSKALIAKLIEGMEPPAWFSVEEDSGFDFALTEIRRRAGLEVES
jgi:hypothetical protein